MKVFPFYGLLLLCCVCTSDVLPASRRKHVYTIGGMFNDEDSAAAFASSVQSQFSYYTEFKSRSSYIPTSDSFMTLRAACALTKEENGVVAVVRNDASRDALSAICKRLNIPELITAYVPPLTKKLASQPTSDLPYSFYYYPSPLDVAKAIAKLVVHLGWDDVTFLYEEPESISRLQEVMKNRAMLDNPSIMFYKLDPSASENKQVFKEMFIKNNYKIIMDCHRDRVLQYFNEIVQVNNKTDYQSYILTSLDAHTLDFTNIKGLEANISTLHLADASDVDYNDLKKLWSMDILTLDAVLVADATTHLMTALNSLKMEEDAENAGPYMETTVDLLPPLCISSTVPWSDGAKLAFHLTNVTTQGISGNIELNQERERVNYYIYHSERRNGHFVKMGFWKTSNWDYVATRVSNEMNRQTNVGNKKTIMVGSSFGKPYFSAKNGTNLEGNDRYYGYVVDLMAAIASEITKATNENFTYMFYENRGGQPGLIEDLQNNKAELAISDMTITHSRSALVDFSQPFMDLGIAILFQKSPVPPSDQFAFIKPIAFGLWFYLLTTYILTSFILFICARMSQADWVNPHPCDRNPERLENIWSINNCTWLTMGSIMTQGCDILPRAVGSRTVTAAWWFFALIITSSYTSNVSVFISNNRRVNEIQDINDLASQNKIKYGVVKGKSTYEFFKSSNDSVHKKIFAMMESTMPSVYCATNEEGKDRVKKGKLRYAFFMESTAIEYNTQRDCSLRMVGGRIDSKEYGIAMPKGSPHRAKINNAIIKLQETGILEELKKKWWEEEENTQRCKEKEEEEEQNKSNQDSLQMENTSGIFVLLGSGAVIAVVFALYDFFGHSRKIAIQEKVNLKTAMTMEWKACLDPRTLSKPVGRTRASSLPPERARRSTSIADSFIQKAESFLDLNRVY